MLKHLAYRSAGGGCSFLVLLGVTLYQVDPNPESTKPVVWDALSDLTVVDEAPDQVRGDAYCGELGTPSSYARRLREERFEGADDTQADAGLTGCRLTIHSESTIERFAATRQGEYETVSRYFRLAENAVGPTQRAGTDRYNGSYTAARPIHPTRDRCITVREAARLHSYPDWFQFHPTVWHGFRQIGNSVPPRLASAVGKSILDLL